LTIVLITGDVNVLLVNVSVVARPTNVSVAAGRVKVVVPATEESINDVIESLTVVPHVPDKSPVVGSAKPSKGEKLVTAIIYP
jgi:hypothetical protein